MGINIQAIGAHLFLKNGIWYVHHPSQVSYPDEGNDNLWALEQDSFWFAHRNNCITTVLKKYPPKGALFDIGGGNGYVAAALQAQGIETVLVEPSENGILRAKKRGVKHLICATLQDLQYPPQSLPAIGLFDVLEHIEDDTAFLKMVKAQLQPNGKLYLTVPAYRWLWSAEDDYTGHFHRYTLTHLRSKLAQAGFYIRYATYFFSILPLPIFFTRSLPDFVTKRQQTHYDLAKGAKEHSPSTGILKKTLDRIWAWEVQQIQKERTIPFGSSCLVVAEAIF